MNGLGFWGGELPARLPARRPTGRRLPASKAAMEAACHRGGLSAGGGQRRGLPAGGCLPARRPARRFAFEAACRQEAACQLLTFTHKSHKHKFYMLKSCNLQGMEVETDLSSGICL
mmetsp:Transcript_40993/g.122399  ORF Transcript_40993/g.122399 Transcript_40993/m.122399 type:complete len:116 (+) Transcript_40993:331-678(+)